MVSSALEAILSAPTDDIVECPLIGASDVQLVCLNLEVILNKCLYCTRLKLPLPLEVLLTMIGDTGDMQPERVCVGLLHTAEEGTCMDLFCEFASQLLARKASAFRLQLDVEAFFKVVQLFCCSTSLKDRLGAPLGDILLRFMRDTELHADDYKVHRNCCSALISILRGSQVNKTHFGPECAVIAACLENSSDFFFQMQCVEVLYRLFKHKSTYLTSAPVNPYLLRGIEELPNDSTLLLSIHQLLDNYNRDTHPDRIVSFAVLHIEVAGVEVARATTLYFSPLLLVVLLPGSTGGYLTIPYEHVRSVKQSKDHKLELRLYVIPAKLSLVMSLDDGEGRDKLQISMTRATMHELRSSIVHQWVADRKKNAPHRLAPPQRPRQQQRESPPPPPLSSSSSAPRLVEVSREGAAALLNADTAASLRRTSPAMRSHTGESPLHHHTINLSANATTRSKSSPIDAAASGLESCGPQGSFSGTRELQHALDSSAIAGDAEEAQRSSYLSEVHRAASIKAVRYREEQHEHLQHAVDEVKLELEELHRWGTREREAYETNFREDMAVVRRSEAVLKESAADCVQTLNGELEDVQALGALLKAEVDKVRERLAKSLGKSEGVEEAFLVRIKQMVDTSMRHMEETLVVAESTASSSSPGGSLSAVTQYIAQQMQAISDGTGVPGSTARTVAALPQHQQQLKSRRLDYT